MPAAITILLALIVQSGRVQTFAETPSQRVSPPPSAAPGPPPVISFRFFEGTEHRRFSGLDLTLDDAGH